MLLSDLEELENIIDDIVVELEEDNYDTDDGDDTDSIEDLKSLFDTDEVINDCLQIMYDYVTDNPSAISEPDFRDNMIDHTTEIMNIILENNILLDDEIENDIDNMMNIAEDLFYLHFMPCRSFPNTFSTKPSNINKMSTRLKYLSELLQPAQRTPEWYAFRHQLITASNAYKAFENDSARNQLIYEKCQPIIIETTTTTPPKNQFVNVNSPMHWGQKYEPLSVMYYEHIYKTKVQDFGCIQHETYHFLGASPDGIISDHTLPNFGRMLEIKNIVNREITGIPKKEYWVQTQLQMETCDLDECDFLETRFVEYNSDDEFNADGDFLTTDGGNYKGIIMYFSTNEGRPIYVYKPLLMTEEYFNDVWEQKMIEEKQQLGYTWIKNLFWKLEEVSCVLVLRNKKWFRDNVHVLKELWGIIEKERISGFEHRAPKKRIKKEDVVGLNLEINSCLLNIDKSSGKISVGKFGASRSVSGGERLEHGCDRTPSTNVYGVPSLFATLTPGAFGYGSLQSEQKCSNSILNSNIDTSPSINPGTNIVIKIRTESFDETKK